MNFTQPSLLVHLKPKKKQTFCKFMSTQNTPYLGIPQQIHRAPQSIRKALKNQKHRRPYKSNNIEYPTQLNDSTQYKQQKQHLRMHINVKQAIKYIGKNDQYIKYASQKAPQETDYDIISQTFKYQAPRMRASGDRMLYIRKKLSPLRKGLTVQPKCRANSYSEKKHMKITFFNVEKLNLVKMYSQLSSAQKKEKNGYFQNEEQQLMREQQRYGKFHHSIYGGHSAGSSPLNEDILKNADFFGVQISSPAKSLRSDKVKTMIRFKNFIPPFQRYYYIDFIWKVALSNNMKLESPNQYPQKLKIFIGRGNNSCLIRTLFKRRSAWWQFVDKVSQANLIWVQIKINQFFKCQAGPRMKEVKLVNIHNNHTTHNEKPLTHRIDQLKKLGTSYQQNKSILQDAQIHTWNQYFNQQRKVQQKLDPTMVKRNKLFKFRQDANKIQSKTSKMQNHLANNYVIGNKKALFYTMSKYYQMSGQNVFDYLPLTFHIQNGLEDPQYLKFLNNYYERAKKIRSIQKQREDDSPKRSNGLKNVWIVKPGQFTNRGNGISVCFTLEDIKKILKKRQKHDNGNLKTYIVQSYLDKPFLYCRRKFDLRHYMMITCINGRVKGYWCKIGYVRTTSYEYTLKQSFTSIHLTNDAVQKNLPDYGKYEKGNKISYEQLQKYLEKQYKGKYDFYKTVYPRMKKIATDAMRASALSIDPQKKQHNFQIFGMDFMIDSEFNPWLIQINTNPCYQLSCPLLSQIIPEMLQNALKISVDSVFPPPANFNEKRPKFNDKVLENNKFEIVYDSTCEEEDLKKLFDGFVFSAQQADLTELEKEDDQVFDDDGVQLQD